MCFISFGGLYFGLGRINPSKPMPGYVSEAIDIERLQYHTHGRDLLYGSGKGSENYTLQIERLFLWIKQAPKGISSWLWLGLYWSTHQAKNTTGPKTVIKNRSGTRPRKIVRFDNDVIRFNAWQLCWRWHVSQHYFCQQCLSAIFLNVMKIQFSAFHSVLYQSYNRRSTAVQKLPSLHSNNI